MAIFILFFCLSEFGGKRRIVQITSAVISLGNGISDDHQRCLGDLVLFRRLGKCSNGADERLLLRPGCFVNDRCRSICRIAACNQLTGKLLGDTLYLARTTLRAEGDLFRCGMSPAQLSEKLGGVNIEFIENDGAGLVENLLRL